MSWGEQFAMLLLAGVGLFCCLLADLPVVLTLANLVLVIFWAAGIFLTEPLPPYKKKEQR